METQTYKRAKDVSWQEMGGKGILISIENSMTHELNHTALEIWKYLEDGKTATQVEEHLANKYSISIEAVREDVANCLNTFQDQSLLEVNE